jgi:hypothetical protein
MSADRHTQSAASPSRSTVRRRIAAAGCALALGLGVGASQAHAVPQAGGQASHPTQAPAFHGPPDVRLGTESISLSLHPYTSCWSSDHGGVCYDGIPPKPLPSLGGVTEQVQLAFPRDGWHFRVTATDAQGQQSRVRLIPSGSHEWRLALASRPAGRYALDIFGRGPQGDVAVAAALTLT